jgi:AraC family transcriptional activator of pobA
MADLAQDLGVTPTHLSRVCKDIAGQTAADLLTERLLHAARDRVERTDLPFQVIAAELGFGSAAYFTRFLHAHTRMSPTNLRRAAQK